MAIDGNAIKAVGRSLVSAVTDAEKLRSDQAFVYRTYAQYVVSATAGTNFGTTALPIPLFTANVAGKIVDVRFTTVANVAASGGTNYGFIAVYKATSAATPTQVSSVINTGVTALTSRLAATATTLTTPQYARLDCVALHIGKVGTGQAYEGVIEVVVEETG